MVIGPGQPQYSVGDLLQLKFFRFLGFCLGDGVFELHVGEVIRQTAHYEADCVSGQADFIQLPAEHPFLVFSVGREPRQTREAAGWVEFERPIGVDDAGTEDD